MRLFSKIGLGLGCLLPLLGLAQTLPVGQLGLDGSLRNQQLMGQMDPKRSFTIRPLYGEHTAGIIHLLDSSVEFTSPTYKILQKGSLVILPALLTTKFNSHHPYGWNDEGMLAAKGLQTVASAGIFAQYGRLSVQLQPQLVFSANPDFASNVDYGSKGVGAVTKLLPGQSSIRLAAGPVSFGFSTENLWWGPGQYSALLLSNNAPGFAHFSINTNKPINTPIGSFEFQLIGGRLSEDSAAGGLYENFHLKPAGLKDDWRYMNAVVVSYQPRFLKGFFFGATRAFQFYGSDFKLQSGSIFNKYVPVLSAVFKNNAGGAAEDARARDQQISLFSRMVFPASHTEFYVEYGWNDHKANSRDLLINPEHAAAYIVGGKKLVSLAKPGDWLELSGELTHMAQSPDYIVRNAGNWYVHGQVSQGMTHQRQILGAGSGFGNNVQTFTANWFRGIKRIGLIVQRIQHDPMRLDGNFGNIGLRENAWTEVAVGVQGRWNFKKLLASVELQHAGSKHYAWEKGRNVSNIYGLLNIAYTW